MSGGLLAVRLWRGARVREGPGLVVCNCVEAGGESGGLLLQTAAGTQAVDAVVGWKSL